MVQLRPYQRQAIDDVKAAWASGKKNVMLVMPTGSGKTHTKSALHAELNVPTFCVAHRQELIVQISESLASFGIRHQVIAPPAVIALCASRHWKKHKQSFVSNNAQTYVASAQTMLRRGERMKNILSRIQVWDVDEAHHCLPDNTWGKVAGLMPNAKGLGVTATPERCDGKPLDGVFDHMVVGPGMRDMIDAGYLTDYRIFCPPSDVDIAAIPTSSSTGDFIQPHMREVMEQSMIVGDVVRHYKSIAGGKPGLTFTVSVKAAIKIADAHNLAGVPAQVVSAKTPDDLRVRYLDQLASGDLLQLVNVDLFGEGMDCPAVEVISMARPTKSFGLYCQQFGRAVRPKEGKTHATIIDHVGNVIRHGLPDAPREWSLAGRKKRNRGELVDEIPLTMCDECLRVRERHIKVCPYCGHTNQPAERSAPEFVDGDLAELDPAVLEKMRNRAEEVMGPPRVPTSAAPNVVVAVKNRWKDRSEAQVILRDWISKWSGVYRFNQNLTDGEIHRKFFLTFGVDVMSAQTLGKTDALELCDRIRRHYESL